MSLINDALKKVSEAERGKPSAAQADFETRAMQPVYQERSNHLFWVSVALFVGAIGVVGFVYAKSRTAAPEPVAVQPAKVVPEAQPIVAKIAATEPAKAVAPQADVPVPAALTLSNTTVTATPAPVTAPAVPTFRLKGILYTKNPTALINEGSVQVGGEINGATVTKIESTTVTLDYQGKTTVLKLGAH